MARKLIELLELTMRKSSMTDRYFRHAAEECCRYIRKSDKPVMDITEAVSVLTKRSATKENREAAQGHDGGAV